MMKTIYYTLRDTTAHTVYFDIASSDITWLLDYCKDAERLCLAEPLLQRPSSSYYKQETGLHNSTQTVITGILDNFLARNGRSRQWTFSKPQTEMLEIASNNLHRYDSFFHEIEFVSVAPVSNTSVPPAGSFAALFGD
jgi:hypothetical protein